MNPNNVGKHSPARDTSLYIRELTQDSISMNVNNVERHSSGSHNSLIIGELTQKIPYEYENCGKTFSRKSPLSVHQNSQWK